MRSRKKTEKADFFAENNSKRNNGAVSGGS